MNKDSKVTGADILCDVLLANDVKVCFANPGTSEMHFVAALDRKTEMRCILGLFEGVVTGAADGYARISGKPAATLLHLGSGLSNGLANLHNAKRARSPIVNVIGDHATYHSKFDAPLTSDIQAIASPVSHWVKTTEFADQLASNAMTAISVATGKSGQIASLILPADVAWSPVESEVSSTVVEKGGYLKNDLMPDQVRSVARKLVANGASATLFLGGAALYGEGLRLAGAISRASNAKLLAETFSKRLERGQGRPLVPILPYPVDQAIRTLEEVGNLVLVGSREPVAFFAYPGKPSLLTSSKTTVTRLVSAEEDVLAALRLLAAELGVDNSEHALESSEVADGSMFTGKLTSQAVCSLLAQTMPEGTIIVDEAISSGRDFPVLSQHSAPHDYLQLTGGAIGIGIPMATGAAVASQDRGSKVITLQADGSGMYTLQGLWTQARENLNCLTIVFANHNYASLHLEMANVGVTELGHNAARMLDLVDPKLSWTKLAQGLGVEARRVDNVVDFKAALAFGLANQGPFLIEVIV